MDKEMGRYMEDLVDHIQTHIADYNKYCDKDIEGDFTLKDCRNRNTDDTERTRLMFTNYSKMKHEPVAYGKDFEKNADLYHLLLRLELQKDMQTGKPNSLKVDITASGANRLPEMVQNANILVFDMRERGMQDYIADKIVRAMGKQLEDFKSIRRNMAPDRDCMITSERNILKALTSDQFKQRLLDKISFAPDAPQDSDDFEIELRHNDNDTYTFSATDNDHYHVSALLSFSKPGFMDMAANNQMIDDELYNLGISSKFNGLVKLQLGVRETMINDGILTVEDEIADLLANQANAQYYIKDYLPRVKEAGYKVSNEDIGDLPKNIAELPIDMRFDDEEIRNDATRLLPPKKNATEKQKTMMDSVRQLFNGMRHNAQHTKSMGGR